MDNCYLPCTKCGKDKRNAMFCDECTLPHCDDCGYCTVTAPTIWQHVLEDLKGFPLDLVTPAVAALAKVRDEQLSGLREQVARVDARHRPTETKLATLCTGHNSMASVRSVPFAEVAECRGCQTTPALACSNITCCYWPCADHLALHGETEETCAHRSAGEPAREAP